MGRESAVGMPREPPASLAADGVRGCFWGSESNVFTVLEKIGGRGGGARARPEGWDGGADWGASLGGGAPPTQSE